MRKEQTMQAQDIMSSPVISVAPDAAQSQVVELLLAHRISGVPVVADGQVVGMVGDGELVHRREIGTGACTDGRSWWQRLVQPDPAAAAYVHSHGTHVRDAMSSHVVAIAPDAALADIAAHFEDRRIRRLPVLRQGRLVGLVTRADLVRAIARCTKGPYPPSAAQDDEAIRARLVRELASQPWWSQSWSSVEVDHGIVRYRGVVRGEAEKLAARVAAENVPGVRGVDDRRMPHDEWQPML